MNKVLHITTRIMLRLLLTIAVVILLVVVALQFHWVQQRLIHAATAFISDKTHTRVEVGRIAISFPKNIVLEHVFVEDLQHDTLLAVTELSVGADMMALLKGKVVVSDLTLSGATSRIRRTLPDSAFNFDFLIDVFVSSNAASEVSTETTSPSEAPVMSVGKLVLNNVRFLYDDEVTGVFTENNVGSLSVYVGAVDLNRMSFTVDELYMANTSSVVELKPVPDGPDEPEDTSALPFFSANKIECEAVDFEFRDPADSLFLSTHVGELELYPQLVDLNKQKIDVRSLAVKRSTFNLKMFEQQETPSTEAIQDTLASIGWTITAGKIVMEENAFAYDVTNIPQLTKGFDYNHIGATHIGMDARSVFYSDEGVRGEVKNLMATEQSGVAIEKLRTRFSYDDTHAELANLYLQTSRSIITKSLKVTYPSVASMAEHPENIGFNFYFDNTHVDMRDVLVFAPELETDPMVKKYARQQVKLNGSLTGKVSNLQLKNLIVQTATQTAVSLNGTVKGLPNTDALWVDMRIPFLTTSRNDLSQLLPDSTIPTMITLPQKIMVKGNVKGSVKDIESKLLFQTSDGTANIAAAYKMEDTVPVYDIALSTTRFNIGAIFNQPMIGMVTGDIKTTGKSFDPKNMSTTLSGDLSLLELNRYGYTGVLLDASVVEGLIKSQLQVKDSNINLLMTADASVKPEQSYANIGLSVVGASLKELNLTQGVYKTNVQLKVSLFDVLEHKLHGNIGIGKLVVATSKQNYTVDSLLTVSVNEERNQSEAAAMIKANYSGQTELPQLSSVIEYCISQYWGKPMPVKNTENENFTCTIQVTPHEMITDLLVPGLKQFQGAKVKVDYTGRSNALAVSARVPLAEYEGTTFNNILLKVHCNNDSMMYTSSVESVSGSDYFIDRTSIDGSISHQHLLYNVKIANGNAGYKLKVTGMMEQEGDSMVLQWLNDRVVLNNEQWNIDKTNRIVIHSNGVNIRQFNLSSGQQFVNINSTGTHLNAPLNIEFGNFDLATLSHIIEKDSALVEGIMDGKIKLNPADKLAFTSNLSIKHIVLKGLPVGDLFVNAESHDGERYNAQVSLSGNDNEAKLAGYYENNELHFQLDVHKITMRSIEAFVPGTIRRSSGYIAGAVKISGKADKPLFNGDVALKDASFNIAMLNNRLTFKDEHILLNNEGIQFKKFTALDSVGQPLVINGSVITGDYSNVKLALDITTEKFRVFNTTEKDNPVYYGVIMLNSVIKIRGTQKMPVIDADVNLIDGSDLTFVVQQGELSIDRGDGVVVFVDTSAQAVVKDTNTVLVSELTGLNITANIEVSRNTKFKVITDKVSGDNLEVSGDAKMQFAIDESGKISLVGAYVLNSGSYKASLQKIVKRDFIIRKGSTITWGGDPFDALLDIVATYKARTGATDLLAAELMGVPEDQRAQYRKLLNYDVNLVMRGFLLKPDPKFYLDMPLKDQQAFNGMVYAKITQINNNENELNKQVFSLLVLGRFLPVGTASNVTTSSAVSSIARNSVNQIFSDQLNALSGKYIKGADLNFNLQTNDDYTAQGTQQNTELQIGLKKELFNNRVVVKVGSNIDVGATANQANNQNITGDMVMEYKITEDGTYRFKAFRENGYEGIIDGLLYKTGIGFLYSKDYDSISQLFTRPKKEEALKLKEEEVE